MRDTYTYLKFPWISKSTYKTFKACKFMFLWKVINGLVSGQNRWMAQGSGLHLLFYKFFDVVDFDVLYKLDWSYNNGTKDSPVFRYFYACILSIVKLRIEDKHMKYNIVNFCLFEENHFVDLMTTYTTKRDIKRNFMPSLSERECFMKHDGFKIFGTVDRIFVENGIKIIADYKTGKVPKKLKEEIRSSIYTKVNLGHYTVEGNFYILLQSLIDGYIWEERPHKKTGKMQWIMTKDGKEVSVSKLYDYAFIFTSSKEFEYFVARKKASLASIRAILKNLPIIRAWDDWYRQPNIMRCKNCAIYQDKCRGKVPFEIYGNVFGSKDTPQKSIQDVNWSSS